MSKLQDKALAIDFTDLDSPLTPEKAPNQDSQHPSAAQPSRQPRSGVEAIGGSIAMRQRNQELEEKLRSFEDIPFVQLLHPSKIHPSSYKNRDERSYLTEDFQNLKNDISLVGRNVQPIKVRVTGHDTDGPIYELVYGRRRHRACLELGLDVTSIIVHNMSDQQAFIEADKENQLQKNLSPWEQGVKYNDAIKSGLFPSMARLASVLGISTSNVSRAIAVGTLPQVVIDAFSSPLDIQFRWGVDIQEAIDRDAAQVTSIAKELSLLTPRLIPSQVYKRLIERLDSSTPPSSIDLLSGEKPIGSLLRDKRGNLTLKIKSGVLNTASEEKILTLIKSLAR